MENRTSTTWLSYLIGLVIVALLGTGLYFAVIYEPVPIPVGPHLNSFGGYVELVLGDDGAQYRVSKHHSKFRIWRIGGYGEAPDLLPDDSDIDVFFLVGPDTDYVNIVKRQLFYLEVNDRKNGDKKWYGPFEGLLASWINY